LCWYRLSICGIFNSGVKKKWIHILSISNWRYHNPISQSHILTHAIFMILKYSESVMEVEVWISEVRCELRGIFDVWLAWRVWYCYESSYAVGFFQITSGLLALDDKLETRVAYDDTFFHYSISMVKKGLDLLWCVFCDGLDGSKKIT
jgi:hypothetical protein